MTLSAAFRRFVVIVIVAVCASAGLLLVQIWEPERRDAEQEARNDREKVAADILATEQMAYYTKILAIVTGALVGTGIIQLAYLVRADETARIAAEAAKRSADALPTLERAYVYCRMLSTNIGELITDGPAWETSTVTLSAAFIFKNFGKTPARLVSGEMTLHRLPADDRVHATTEWPIGYLDILASDEETRAQSRTLDLLKGDLLEIERGRLRILLAGWLTYLDVWGEEHTIQPTYVYNPSLRRFVADHPGKDDGNRLDSSQAIGKSSAVPQG